MEEYFYHTDKLTRLVRLYTRDRAREEEAITKFNQFSKLKQSTMVLDRADRTFYTNEIYFPKAWETWSQRKLSSYRSTYSLKFFIWALMNKSKVQSHSQLDWKYISASRNQLTFNCSLISGLAVVLNAFLKRLDPPFFYEAFLGRRIKPKHLRIAAMVGASAYLIFRQVNSQVDSDSLFDTGLKYKQWIDAETLKDDKIDKILSNRGMQAAK